MLLQDFSCTDRTTASRKSQWVTWVQFCEEEGLNIFPVTEAHIMAFIEWISIDLDSNRLRI